MVADGEGQLSGGIHGESFQAISHYFQQRHCRSCEKPYTPEGIEFLREEPGVIVVRVGCALCGRPLGIALVGMNTMSPACPGATLPTRKATEVGQFKDWSKRDKERLSKKPPISYDDVLAAHEFFASLGADWASLLPKVGKGTNRIKSS
jgi:hypothetical protein